MVKSKSYPILSLLLSSPQLWKKKDPSLYFHRSWKNKSHLSPLKDLLRCVEPMMLGLLTQTSQSCNVSKMTPRFQRQRKNPDSVHVLTDVIWFQRSETGSKWVLNLCGNAHKLWNVRASNICRTLSQSGPLPMCFIYFHLFVRVISCFFFWEL